MAVHGGMNVRDLIRKVSREQGVAEEEICCLSEGKIVLPFVRLRHLARVEVRFARKAQCRSGDEPAVRRSHGQGASGSRRHEPSNFVGIRRSPRVRAVVARVNGEPLRFVVDTGAAVTLIYASQALKCGVADMIDRRRCCCPLIVGAGGDARTAVGTIRALELDIGGVKTRANAVVMDEDFDTGLIGIDWLDANRAVLDIAGDCMHVAGGTIHFQD